MRGYCRGSVGGDDQGKPRITWIWVMKNERVPAVIRVISISHLIVGACFLPCSLCVSWLAIFNPALSGGHGEVLQRAFLEQQIPGYGSIFAVLALSSSALSTLL